MSTFWTPDGERPIGSNAGSPSDAEQHAPTGQPAQASAAGQPSQEQLEAQMAELHRQLSETPASTVVANHCFGLFELAALHLGNRPPKLAEAQLAIDALGALVENLAGRLGEAEGQLREGLTQLRVAYVQIRQNNEQQQN